MKIIFDYNRTIFNPETDEFYPGVFRLIKELSKKCELFLISCNEPRRKDRMEESGLSAFFKKMEFVDRKTETIFLKLIKKGEKIFVVGDSLKSEISIGNRLGFMTIRVKAGKFSTQIPQTKEEIANYEINDIRELKDVINLYE